MGGELSVKVIDCQFAFPFIIHLQPEVSNPFQLPLRTEKYDPRSIVGITVAHRAFPGMTRALFLWLPSPLSFFVQRGVGYDWFRWFYGSSVQGVLG
jgi:hypothetical protein